jgi:hypothetical protein
MAGVVPGMGDVECVWVLGDECEEACVEKKKEAKYEVHDIMLISFPFCRPRRVAALLFWLETGT